MADSCPPELEWETRQGVREYIQRKTREDPYYALVTGVLHGAPADYTATQPYVDEILRQGPEHFTRASENARFLNTHLKGAGGRPVRYQFSRQKAPVLAEMSQCFLDNINKGRMGAAKHCANRDVKGIGRKGRNLVLEYLGDDNAVAVDRHVFNYLNLYRGWTPPRKVVWGSHGIRVDDEEIQEAAEKEIKRIAHECGKKPSEVQVAAWLKGACDARLKAKGRKGKPVVWMGEDKIIQCREREHLRPSGYQIRRTKKPRRATAPAKVRPLF